MWDTLILNESHLRDVSYVKHTNREAANPPRPPASRRVELLTQQQTLLTSQNLQTNLLGGGFTLPLPPPRPLGSDSRSRLWRARGPLDPSKSFVKMSISCLRPHLAPIKVVMLTLLAQKILILTILLPRSRHLDDFSMKKGLRASIYRWPHLFIDRSASIYR